MAFPRTRLILIRHGETAANVAGRMQGRGDDPLTPRGQGQVRAIAQRLKDEGYVVSAVYTSPLLRGRHTADTIAAEFDLISQTRDGLQEMNLGTLEGVSEAELAAAVPQQPDERYPSGESGREFVERVMGTLYGLVAAHPDETVVAVSHGAVISTALAIWAVGRGDAWRDYARRTAPFQSSNLTAAPRSLPSTIALICRLTDVVTVAVTSRCYSCGVVRGKSISTAFQSRNGLCLSNKSAIIA